jgi:hypothetical protein
MEVKSEFFNGQLSLSFQLDKDDISKNRNSNIKLNHGIEVFIELGSEVESLHPDQIALASILICNPFVGKELIFPEPVSPEFYNVVSKVISKYRIRKNVSDEIVSLKKRESGLPSLAFSGGADSTAALSVMPKNTIPVFLKRPETKGSVYDHDAPLEICDSLSQFGYDVKIVSSNLELIRSPLGFPTDLAHSVPIILLSRSLNINSISFGTIMESGYGIGHEKYHEYQLTAHKRFYSALFGSIGIDLSMPVMGVSEVGTAIICNKSPFGEYSQSCIRGTWKRPCMSCWKCFRKELLSASIGHRDAGNLIPMLSVNEVQLKLSAYPISHENVITYALQRLDLSLNPELKPLAAKLNMSLDLSFLESWYSPSIDLVPDSMRHSTRNEILKLLRVMSPLEEMNFYNWDMNDHLNSVKTRKAQEKLTSFWQDLKY